MKITNKDAGTGFTARVITTYSHLSTDEDLRFVLDQLPKRAPDSRHPFPDYLDALEAGAREVLRRHGLPDELVGYCRNDDGIWVKSDIDDERTRRICAPEVVIREAGYAHDTAPGYAVRILRLIADLKGSGADPAILNLAFELGDLVRECRIKSLRRRQVLPGGRSRGNSNADRNEWMAREFNKRLPAWHLGETALALDVAARWARKNSTKPLGRSSADAAVKAGMKILSGVRCRPDG